QFGVQPDYPALFDYFAEGRFLVETHCFVPIDPRNPHARDRAIEALWQAGCIVHQKVGALAGDTYKCDFDVEITLELMRTAEIVQPDIIVLASGDKDFIPVILELRRRGIRVEVAAFAGINAAREVMLKASGFINICRYLAEQNNTDQESLEPDEEVADDYSASEPQAETEDDQPMIRNYSIPSSAEYAQ
ncbi:NYN domain-containing protein, partial [Chromatium okenii]|uniref:NYN domain-containing protein n=1 Tax=Chromatium okenii TaxID=61644 RepID=UPI0026F22354